MHWKDFEYFSKYLLESVGYGTIQVTPKKGKRGGDRGIDLKIRLDTNEVLYGQCKHWSSRHNGLLPSIRELSGCMTRDGVRRGVFLVSVNATTLEFHEASNMGIEIIDLKRIFEITTTLFFEENNHIIASEEEIEENIEDYFYFTDLKYPLFFRLLILPFEVCIWILISIFFGAKKGRHSHRDHSF